MVECGKEKTQDIQLKKGGNLLWKAVVHFRRLTFGLKGQRSCCVCLLSSSVLLCYSPPVFLSWAEVVIVSVPQHCALWLDCFLCVIRQIYWTLITKVLSRFKAHLSGSSSSDWCKSQIPIDQCCTFISYLVINLIDRHILPVQQE